MRQDDAIHPRYEWAIRYPESEFKEEIVVNGATSTDPLADLFARWTQGYGNLAVWPEAVQFGTLVARHSTLRVPVVAVWLGLEADALTFETEIMRAQTDQCWEFESPHGRPMKLTKTIVG